MDNSEWFGREGNVSVGRAFVRCVLFSPPDWTDSLEQ